LNDKDLVFEIESHVSFRESNQRIECYSAMTHRYRSIP